MSGRSEQFVCTTCQATFSNSTWLTRHHVYAHYKEKPFSCDKCCARFSRKYHLNRHSTSCNRTKQNLFSCRRCDKKFNTKDSVSRHVKRIHGVSNNVEGLRIQDDNKLVRYFCRHTLCKQSFKDRPSWLMHLESHALNSNGSFGEESKTLRSTINGNIQNRTCQVCDLAFIQFEDFQKHLWDTHRMKSFIHLCADHNCA